MIKKGTLLFLFASQLVISYAQQAGDLDLDFGVDGLVTTPIGGNTDFCDRLFVLDNNQILAIGYTVNTDEADFAMVKYQADGSIDPSFGDGGKVVTDWGGADYATGIIPLDNGDLLVSGRTDAGGDDDFALVKYDADGNLDTSFGTDGLVTTDFDGDTDASFDIIRQGDGVILVGKSRTTSGVYDFSMAKYDFNGDLDPSFGDNGKVISHLGTANDRANRIDFQSDGKIVLSGIIYNGSNLDFAIARYQPDGSIDLSFGDNGKVFVDFFDDQDVPNDMVVQADDKILVTGYAIEDGEFQFATIRLNEDGTLDNTFGASGKLITYFESPYTGGISGAIALQADGKILIGGELHQDSNNDFGLVRLNEDGSFDLSFGDGGKVMTDFAGDYDEMRSIIIQSDQNILAGGYATIIGSRDMALARYLSGLSVGVKTTPLLDNLLLFPNPVTSSAIVEFNLNEAAEIQITLVDDKGRTINKWPKENYTRAGKHNLLLSFDFDLPPGHYFLQLSNGKEENTLLMIKQ